MSRPGPFFCSFVRLGDDKREDKMTFTRIILLLGSGCGVEYNGRIRMRYKCCTLSDLGEVKGWGLFGMD